MVVVAVVLGGALANRAHAATPTGNQVLERAVAQLEGVRDVSLVVQVEQFDPASGRKVGVMAAQLQAVVDPAAVRLTLTGPQALAGQIIMIDGVKQLAYVYSPVTEQVTAESLEQFGSQFGPAFGNMGKFSAFGKGGTAGRSSGQSSDLRSLLQLPDPQQYPATLVRTATVNGVSAYVVDAVNTQALILQRFWVATQSYQVLQIETYDARNRLTSRVSLSQWKFNSGLESSRLLKWPAGATLAQ